MQRILFFRSSKQQSNDQVRLDLFLYIFSTQNLLINYYERTDYFSTSNPHQNKNMVKSCLSSKLSLMHGRTITIMIRDGPKSYSIMVKRRNRSLTFAALRPNGNWKPIQKVNVICYWPCFSRQIQSDRSIKKAQVCHCSIFSFDLTASVIIFFSIFSLIFDLKIRQCRKRFFLRRTFRIARQFHCSFPMSTCVIRTHLGLLLRQVHFTALPVRLAYGVHVPETAFLSVSVPSECLFRCERSPFQVTSSPLRSAVEHPPPRLPFLFFASHFKTFSVVRSRLDRPPRRRVREHARRSKWTEKRPFKLLYIKNTHTHTHSFTRSSGTRQDKKNVLIQTNHVSKIFFLYFYYCFLLSFERSFVCFPSLYTHTHTHFHQTVQR